METTRKQPSTGEKKGKRGTEKGKKLEPEAQDNIRNH